MASLKFSLTAGLQKDTGKAEILARFRNTRLVAQRAKTHLFISPEDFDITLQKVIINTRRMSKELINENTELQEKLNDITEEVMRQSNQMRPEDIQAGWLQQTIDKALFPEEVAAQELREESQTNKYFEAYQKFMQVKGFGLGRQRHYMVLYRMLQRFQAIKKLNITFDSITPDFLRDFEQFLREEHTYFKENKKGIKEPVGKYKKIYERLPEARVPGKRGDNHIKGVFKMLRAFQYWAISQELTTNNPFKKYVIGADTYGTPIYITKEERDHIYTTDLSAHPHLERQRDIFIFQCHIGTRVTDMYSLKKDNFGQDAQGRYLSYIPGKTKSENPRIVKVYLSKVATEIIDKYNDPETTDILPLISQQKYNDAIKEIFRKAGITRMVPVINPKTGETEQKSIADVASSHMARRTFVGTLYKQVKDPNLVGKLSGHVEGSRAFARYRDIDDQMIKGMTNLLD